MKVIIAEKPSVARDIARVLKATEKKQGYIEGSDYKITWAFGHLVRLIDPDEYDPALGKWQLKDLPIIPADFKIDTSKDNGARTQFEIIKQLITSDATDEVICATDAGREGELIFRLIYSLSNCTKPIKRLWISSQTDDAILEGFKTLKPGDHYQTLYDCARSRAEADWLIGINATRAYTIRFARGQGVLSVGRVQTPVLKMIVDRYIANTTFDAQAYYEIEAAIKHPNGNFTGLWINAENETRLSDKAGAEAIVEALKSTPDGKIESVVTKDKRESPPLLYDLTELQKECNRKFKFSAERTLEIAQALYETHKVITYPRTSSRYLSADLVPKLPTVLKSISGIIPELAETIANLQDKPLNITKRMVDDTKVTDHHAIIPTGQSVKNARLSADETKVMELIIRRLVAGFMPDCLKESTEIISRFGEHAVKSNGIVTKQKGWRDAYSADDDEDASTALPIVKKNDAVIGKSFKLLSKKTKAPPLHTEASILAAMETAGRQIDDDELREAMKECGLGTPATRAQILERLLSVKYITRDKNRLVPTEKGIQLISLIRDKELLSPELTGEFERKLNLIRTGQLGRPAYMAEIAEFARRISLNVQSALVTPAIGKCPRCDGDVGETPKAYSCRNWKTNGCKFAIWKEMSGAQITKETAETLLKTGTTEKIEGFKAKSGKEFSAKLTIRDGTVIMTF
ncbi:type IA DNA topoisomerase [bacterium]|nr:type IA DNA topoisomerase [bacterium]